MGLRSISKIQRDECLGYSDAKAIHDMEHRERYAKLEIMYGRATRIAIAHQAVGDTATFDLIQEVLGDDLKIACGQPHTKGN